MENKAIKIGVSLEYFRDKLPEEYRDAQMILVDVERNDQIVDLTYIILSKDSIDSEKISSTHNMRRHIISNNNNDTIDL